MHSRLDEFVVHVPNIYYDKEVVFTRMTPLELFNDKKFERITAYYLTSI